jgi:hypothetical protein
VIPPGLPTQESDFTVGPSITDKNFVIALGKDIGGTITGSVAIPSTTKVYVFLYKDTVYKGFLVADPDGKFLFKGLPDGTDYKILAVAAGYLPRWYDGKTTNGSADPINITGGSKTDANIQLTKQP